MFKFYYLIYPMQSLDVPIQCTSL